MRSLQNAQCAEETSQDQTARQTKPSQATVVQGPARKIEREHGIPKSGMHAGQCAYARLPRQRTKIGRQSQVATEHRPGKRTRQGGIVLSRDSPKWHQAEQGEKHPKKQK